MSTNSMQFLEKIFRYFRTLDNRIIFTDETFKEPLNIRESVLTENECIILSKKHLGLNDEELFYLIEEKQERDECLSNHEMQFLKDEGWNHLSRILYREETYGRSMAISDLINMQFQEFNLDDGNGYKEPINFALDYFGNFYKRQPEEADREILNYFPKMHKYLKKNIFKEDTQFIIDCNFDSQIAYDEFIHFLYVLLPKLYPEKSNRDRQIKRNFNVLHNRIVSMIENE